LVRELEGESELVRISGHFEEPGGGSEGARELVDRQPGGGSRQV